MVAPGGIEDVREDADDDVIDRVESRDCGGVFRQGYVRGGDYERQAYDLPAWLWPIDDDGLVRHGPTLGSVGIFPRQERRPETVGGG